MNNETKNKLIKAYDDIERVSCYLLGEVNFYQDEIEEHGGMLKNALKVLKNEFKNLGIEIPDED